MDLEQIRIFGVLAEELHFRKAAERLHMGQSTLSRHIQGLERDLRIKLVDRTSRRVRLTDAGERLARDGPLLLESYELLESSLRDPEVKQSPGTRDPPDRTRPRGRRD